MTNNINEFLSRLSKVKKTKDNEWIACCPAHDDNNPSLSIKLNDDGKIIMQCFGCYAGGAAIIQAVGMKIEDLFPPRENVKYDTTTVPNKRRLYFSADTVLKCLLHESSIISLAASDSVNGIQFTPDDAARVELAHQRILMATTYCFK